MKEFADVSSYIMFQTEGATWVLVHKFGYVQDILIKNYQLLSFSHTSLKFRVGDYLLDNRVKDIFIYFS